MTYQPALKLSLVILVVLALAGWTRYDNDLQVVEAESMIWVDGTSSLHDWTCEAPAVAGTLEAEASAPEVDTLIESLTRVEITVPVKALDCKKGKMDRKAYDALKADEHPQITYRLQSATVLEETQDGQVALNAEGTLTIAGAERPVTLKVTAKPVGEGSYRFTGRVPLTMTDYGIDPPTALLGTLKTGDDIVVRFDVVAR